jgi:hypothetical protein
MEPDRAGIACLAANDRAQETTFSKSSVWPVWIRAIRKGSEPRAATPAVQAHVLRKTTQRPDDGSTHGHAVS